VRTVIFAGLLMVGVWVVFTAPDRSPPSAPVHPIVTAPRVDASPQDPPLSPMFASESSPTAYQSSTTFHGFYCTVDCSGHRAGYEWAERHGIDDEAQCGGNSQSFIEGCIAYAQEQAGEESKDEQDSEEEDSGEADEEEEEE
jgi:hypothetical protein